MSAGQDASRKAGWKPDRRVLAAVDQYLRLGWPVLPLSPAGDHLVSGMCPRDAQMAMEWWSERPYGIACRVGVVFEVLEMTARLGERVIGELGLVTRTQASVIEVPATGNWLFLVTCNSPLTPELAAHRRVVRLRRDGWIAMPPSPVLGGRVAWVSQGALVHSLVTQTAVLSVLRRLFVARLADGAEYDLGKLAG